MFTQILVLFVAVYYVKLANGAISNKPPDAIVYPGPTQEVLQTRYGSEDDVPEECRGQNYCFVKPPNYPQDKYNRMFADMKDVKQPSVIISELDDRTGDPGEKDGCDSVVTYEPLYQVQAGGRWRKVVQAPDVNYLQRVRLEKCNDKVPRCFSDYPPVPGITTMCRQKTVSWEFLVDDEKGGTERVTAELPICCACMYKMENKRK
ncbi:uncharacterized protein LOC106142789 [Amyelois transitella]|uniref:uncharacterized protein LOC106142789 n=1 Tax=Amyelois transitella TaxID=680683 RepID=UPI00067C75FC|nr:uncharacterized protein LOC106142789 [Amyelois transitella]